MAVEAVVHWWVAESYEFFGFVYWLGYAAESCSEVVLATIQVT